MENNKPIRVLQMTASLYHGGSQNMIVNLYKAIDRNKIQFDFIIDHPDMLDLKPVVEELGAKVYVMPTFKGTNLKEVKKAWNNFFKEHPEYKIIHSHSRSYAPIYLEIAKEHGLKTIIHSHNTSNGSGLKSAIKNVLQKRVRNVADYFIGCSLDAGKWLFGEKIVNSDRFFVLNNAINVDKFVFNKEIRDKYRKELDLEKNKIFIQVGEFNEQKNHEFTIELFKKINEKEPNSKLLLVGTGENFNSIKELISNNNLENNIILLGRRDDVNNLLMTSDVYLMPSRFEGLSLAAIEAQASGIKCVFSDQISKDVEITKTCTFLPLDIETWLNYLLNLTITRLDTKHDIIENGFDVNATAKWLCDFYERIV